MNGPIDNDSHRVRSGSDANGALPCGKSDQSKAGFSSLPVELVIQIFNDVVPDIRDPSTDPRGVFSVEPMLAPLTLSSVCYRWREIALSLPDLWTRGNLGMGINPDLMKLFLERAGPDHIQYWYASTPRMKHVFEKLPLVLENLNMFETLDLRLSHQPDFADDDDWDMGELYDQMDDDDEFLDEEIEVDDDEDDDDIWEDAREDLLELLDEDDQRDLGELSWIRRLLRLPSIEPSTTAQRLRSLYLAVGGSSQDLNMYKAHWCFQLINCTHGLERLSLELPSASQPPELGISPAVLRGLRYLTIKIEGGMYVEDVLLILSCTPNLVELTAPLRSLILESNRALRPSSKRFLDLPELRHLSLRGTHVIDLLRYIYSCIRSAPKLDTFDVSSMGMWSHEIFMDMLSNLPCPIRTFKITLCDMDNWRIEDYLAHPNIEPTLEDLCVDNPMIDETRHGLKDNFFKFMASTIVDHRAGGGRRVVLKNLKKL